MIRIDLLLQFAGRAECSFLSLSAKINFLLIFCDKFCSFIGKCYDSNPRKFTLFQCFPISLCFRNEIIFSLSFYFS